MKLLVNFFALLAILLSSIVSVVAQEEATKTETTTDKSATQSLSITMVDAVSPNKVDLYFSEVVDIDSLRVTIDNQTTKDEVKVLNYQQSDVIPEVVHVILDSSLSASESYKLTVNSVISKNGNTIVEGIDAIRDFVTPAVFNEASTTLNAPDNPNAVVIGGSTTSTTTETNNGEVVTTTETENNSVTTTTEETKTEETKPASTDNLPATGTETAVYFVMIAAILFVIMFSARKRI